MRGLWRCLACDSQIEMASMVPPQRGGLEKRVLYGAISCNQCGADYPVIAGVPILLRDPGKLEGGLRHVEAALAFHGLVMPDIYRRFLCSKWPNLHRATADEVPELYPTPYILEWYGGRFDHQRYAMCLAPNIAAAWLQARQGRLQQEVAGVMGGCMQPEEVVIVKMGLVA